MWQLSLERNLLPLSFAQLSWDKENMEIVFRTFPTLWLFSLNTISSWPSSHLPPQLHYSSLQPSGVPGAGFVLVA